VNHFVKQRLRISLMLFVAFILVSCGDAQEQITVEKKNIVTKIPDSIHTPIETDDHSVHFVDNSLCKNCHTKQFNDWMGSHHEQAMKVASQTTVLGDFDNARFTDAGVTSRFFKKEGKFFINTKNADNEYADFEVKYTFGITPLQQYLLAFPKGRLQAFTIAWNTKENRWFSLYPDEKIDPGNSLHWTNRFFTANSSCIECHTTNMSLNYNVKTKTYNSSWDEINVSCQSCHGAGAQHVEWAQAEKKETDKTVNHAKGLQTDYRSLDAREQVDTCARCHSRRYSVSENDNQKDTFLDNFMPELLREGLYHADGQVIEEVYVYGSFIQSKMYHSGVTCLDCHDPHTLKLRQPGNALCVSCHQSKPPTEKFTRLSSKNYDTPEHHFHTKESAGAQCVNCHMPEKTYMQIDPRRDHRFSVPRPDLSVKWATPNVCNSCHADESAQWAVETMNQWYGEAWQNRQSTYWRCRSRNSLV